MTIPDHLHPAARRIMDRAQRCAPATPASWRLFTQRVAEQTIRDPYAGPDDACAARAILDVLRTAPESVEALLATDRQLNLFAEGGTR